MPAKEYTCTVVEKTWLTPTVFTLRFEPSKKFFYEGGQFLSVVVPAPPKAPGKGKPTSIRRIYSFASPPGKPGYELCVKLVEHGPGSTYLSRLNVGDTFRVSAPYGDFVYEPAAAGRNVCFISTGTGIAPFRAIALSDQFREQPPAHALMIFGAADEKEILYPGIFESYGVEVVHALSKPTAEWTGFRGRVTDYLRSLPQDWAWHNTDFYLCGNGQMVNDVKRILREGRGVPVEAIHEEVYFTPSDRRNTAYAIALKKVA